MKRRFLEIRFIGLLLIFLSTYPLINTSQDEFEKRCLLSLYDKIGQRLNKVERRSREYQFSQDLNRLEFEKKLKTVEREVKEFKTLYIDQVRKSLLLTMLRVLSLLTGISYFIAGIGAWMVKYWTKRAVYVSMCLFGVWQGIFLVNFYMKSTIFYRLFSHVHSLGMLLTFPVDPLERNTDLLYLNTVFSSISEAGWFDEILYPIFFYLIVPFYFFNLHKIKMQFELKRKYG